ncbi:CsxC family protein [Cytobacillus horneckiae]|uniref:DUF3794 domain-containing protein n=1 Tax=Cytobacillus horneckiae TaxID=549687 RepID=A0A2N0ZLT5_9BACI|nr:DUF3794 domain-containing protein [Cytobacillus horneckiae]NRG44815.1 DUF3794 domain-containing protein [Bacillus sp. CRN 9]MCM3178153.1 DUF3794 domain-containing protein [Cytobacillus horneckiae]MEC1157106.1 DUF3794 domain-containing protein [Cytobacillus horneckiae]MED2939868.1 DUF3794 domain-containing protein [Cytobacillus horneckiae]PKG30469.1 DUF3794 domain-containing protein [Cytobacillus horneckiae]
MKKDNDCIKHNKSTHVGECDSSAVTPITTPGGVTGSVTMRVPVTLAERRVTTNLSATIRFPDPVLEIKDIKKRVKIVQCKLLLPAIPENGSPFPDPDDPVVNYMLHLKGFVRKNIQYASPCGRSHGSCVSSEMRSLTTELPFECVTTIPSDEFISPPQLPFLNNRAEFDFFRAQDLGRGFPEKDQLLSSDLSQFHQVSTQFYNQMPFCELLRSDIVEWDESLDRETLNGQPRFGEGVFQSISEKMFLTFDIKVLQNQQVTVDVANGNGGGNG